MQISARNQLAAKVISVNHGSVNSEVVMELPGGGVLVSIITRAAAEQLKLETGSDVYAIIKASNVMIGTED